MNTIVQCFIDRLQQDHLVLDIGRDYVRWRDLNLRVHRSVDDASPLHFELLWPSVSDPSVSLYAKLLCDCALGADFNYAAFTQRAASFVHLGSSYTEEWRNWEIRVFMENGDIHLYLTPQP